MYRRCHADWFATVTRSHNYIVQPWPTTPTTTALHRSAASCATSSMTSSPSSRATAGCSASAARDAAAIDKAHRALIRKHRQEPGRLRRVNRKERCHQRGPRWAPPGGRARGAASSAIPAVEPKGRASASAQCILMLPPLPRQVSLCFHPSPPLGPSSR